MKIDVPGSPNLDDYFVLLFKMKISKNRFIGPHLILFVRLTKPQSLVKSDFEEPVDIKAQYYEMASELQDEGFGAFDRCLRAVRMMDGNLNEARDVLSNIMLTQA